MTVMRGDIVLVNFPMTDGAFKRRPALVVQSDHNNPRLSNSIFAKITSNTRGGFEATQVLIDVATPLGHQSNLRQTSVVKCENIYTLPASALKKIGSLPAQLMQLVDEGLKRSLGLS